MYKNRNRTRARALNNPSATLPNNNKMIAIGRPASTNYRVIMLTKYILRFCLSRDGGFRAQVCV